VDLYTKDGKKIAHLLPFLPIVKDGDVILAKVGREFGQTPEERADIANTLRTLTSGRVRIIVVDESSSVEAVSSQDRTRFT
jgi:hypothetical protein